MKMRKAQIMSHEDRVVLRTRIHYRGKEESLWYSVESQYGDYLDAQRQDGFLLGMLLVAMREGEDIHLEGAISERLYFNLADVMTILCAMMPELRKVAIIPERVEVDPCTSHGGVATSFSGGVDSFCALADHLVGDVSKGYRITHLVMNNTGSHGRGGHALFQQRSRRISRLSQELGLQFVSIDSNLDELLAYSHQQTHTVRDLSAAVILGGLFRRYYYPSTYRYEDCFVGPTYDMAYSEPLLVPLLSTNSVECIATGSRHSRVEKTMRVSEMPISYRYLDVCTDDTGRDADKNCSICNKCLRTLITLEILGRLDLYDKVFDVDKYRKYRKWYLAQVILREDPLASEIADLAVARHYCLHPFPWLLKLIYPVVKPRAMPQFVPAAVQPSIKQVFRTIGCYRW